MRATIKLKPNGAMRTARTRLKPMLEMRKATRRLKPNGAVRLSPFSGGLTND
jgi:hypothetical protein